MRVSWAGLLENAECADTIKVKFWPLSAPSGYTVLPRRGLGADTTAFTVTGLSQYHRYAFQVPSLVLQKVASELHPKVRNHGEGPY